MTKQTNTPASIWSEYEKGIKYNNQIELYEQVKINENFYIGKQWVGLNAPDLIKPVINVIKRVVSYFISMIVSDDVGVSLNPFIESQENKHHAEILSNAVDEVIEFADIKAKSREIIRDAAVDGDGFMYFYFDPEAETGQEAKGRIYAEILPNVNVMFGNPYSGDLQEQPYIIIAFRKALESVRAEAEKYNKETADSLTEDGDSNQYEVSGGSQDGLVTVLLKMWKENGTVKVMKTTKSGIIRDTVDTGLSLYPLSHMRWNVIKNSYHGMAAVTEAIPNQISINQLFAMAIHSVKSTAFPKILFDRTKISGWSNKVGQAIAVVGNPNDAIYSGFRGPDMSGQVMDLIERLVQKTLEFMGASDAALGNIKPDNTSAIIATQKAAAMPLELQRLEFYRFTEEYIRVILDMISVNYGVRMASFTDEDNTVVQPFDYSLFSTASFSLNIDVGSAAYWSEVMQIQTLDNLFSKQIIPDAITYLENIPDNYLRGKNKIISEIKKRQEAAAAAQMSASPELIPGGGINGV